jgi:predicted transcriptional regulator of viral defense system
MLQLLVSQGIAVKESRGVFALADTPLDDFAVISLRWPKAVFRSSSSLYLHGMTDIVPSVYEVSLPRGYKEGGIVGEFPDCLVMHESRELYGLGVVQGVSPTGTSLLLHDRERSICDLTLARKRGEADIQLLGQAMNAYFDSPEKDLPRLMRYAKATGVTAELQPYLEVLS